MTEVTININSFDDPATPSAEDDSKDHVEGDPMVVHGTPAVTFEEPPPSYDSIFGKVRKAKDESSGKVDFFTTVFGGIFCGTVACGIWIAIMLIIPISAIAIGAHFLKDCPRQKYIPIYLIVFGVFGTIKAICSMISQIRQHRLKGSEEEKREGEGEYKPKPKAEHSHFMIDCFLFVWLIAGTVWVYGIHGDYQSTVPGADDYCHRTLYLYSFWLITLKYIGMLLGFCCCCCICVVIGIALKCIF